MNSAIVFSIIFFLKVPPTVSVRNVKQFDKYVDFLVQHISGEVLFCQDSDNHQLAQNIIEKINRQERTGLITIAHAKVTQNRMECQRCDWFVILHEPKKMVNYIPMVFYQNVFSLLWPTSSNIIIIMSSPTVIDEIFMFEQMSRMKTPKVIFLFEDTFQKRIRMINPNLYQHKKMMEVQLGDDLAKIFMNRITNLHGYTLKTAYVEEPNRFYEVDGKFGGVDGEHLNIVLEKLNANVEVVRRLRKKEESNLQIDYVSGNLDINFNPNFQKSYAVTNLVEALYPHDILEVCVLVPKSELVSSLQLFLQPFSIKVWISVIVVIMVLGWGWYRLNRRYSKRKFTRTEIGFQLTRMQITQGFNLASIIVPLRFKRVFVIGFIFWAFVLSQAYQSVMIANLLEPFSYPEINTIEQLNRSELKIVAPHFYHKLIYSIVSLNKLDINSEKYAWALNHVFVENTAYVMSSTDAYAIIYSEKNIKNGRPIMHLMKEPLAYAPKNYYIHKMMPIQKEIDEIMGRIRASGIDQYWKTLAYGRAEIRYKRKLAQATEPVLHLEQFRSAFYVLLIGHSIAFVVFIFELLWARLQRCLNAYFRPSIRH